MDEDQIQIMRERVAASKRKVGLPFDEAKKTTQYSQDLLDQYQSTDCGTSGVAAFRIDAYLEEPANQPISESKLRSISEVLLSRIARHTLSKSDLRIGLALYSYGAFDQQEVTSLVASMKGADDFSVASEAQRLLPIIGADFIQDYLISTELFETDGMGGPQRHLIREMAEAALRDFTCQNEQGEQAGVQAFLTRRELNSVIQRIWKVWLVLQLFGAGQAVLMAPLLFLALSHFGRPLAWWILVYVECSAAVRLVCTGGLWKQWRWGFFGLMVLSVADVVFLHRLQIHPLLMLLGWCVQVLPSVLLAVLGGERRVWSTLQ